MEHAINRTYTTLEEKIQNGTCTMADYNIAMTYVNTMGEDTSDGIFFKALAGAIGVKLGIYADVSDTTQPYTMNKRGFPIKMPSAATGLKKAHTPQHIAPDAK